MYLEGGRIQRLSWLWVSSGELENQREMQLINNDVPICNITHFRVKANHVEELGRVIETVRKILRIKTQ